MHDAAIIGGVIAGMATAARVQAQGLSTIVFEAHGQPGGCAGYFRRRGFSFDVGATTLVDFERGGVGGELLETIGMPPLRGEPLPGYVAWLPGRTVTLYRDPSRWKTERAQTEQRFAVVGEGNEIGKYTGEVDLLARGRLTRGKRGR